MSGPTVREQLEALEEAALSPRAALASRSRGRARAEAECSLRTCYQRDRDRILHSKAFRRLRDKTQVFLAPAGDHYRTRLTHTLEVAQIARTIARALRLNEDLTEAIALGHDLGHTPFGHAGEQVLDQVHPGGFAHNEQSLRVVDVLERDGEGLNLTWEVRDGIQHHTGPGRPATLEGQIVRLADRIAYVNHDIDDAMRAGLIEPADLPDRCRQLLGDSHSARIHALVGDVVGASATAPDIRMSPPVAEALDALRDFLFQNVYIGSPAKSEEEKAKRLVGSLYLHFVSDPASLPFALPDGLDEDGVRQAVLDYVAGMTDRYAIARYESLFVPMPWRLPDLPQR